jgi:hypothetical protein
MYDTRDERDYRNHRSGHKEDEVRRRLLKDEAIFNIARPEMLMEYPLSTQQQGLSSDAAEPLPVSGAEEKGVNTFTYGQRKTMQRKEKTQREDSNLKSETLDPAYAEAMRKGQSYNGVPARRREAAKKAWMKKLEDEDYSGPTLDRSRYLTMRNAIIDGNPRQTEDYRKMCREAVGVGSKPDMERYSHLEKDDFDVIRWVVSRGSGCMWLPDTPRTTVKGFHHRLITKGPPVRVKLFRLNRLDTEWIEKAVEEDVKRGQLEKGNSDWGFPAFPTKETRLIKQLEGADAW